MAPHKTSHTSQGAHGKQGSFLKLVMGMGASRTSPVESPDSAKDQALSPSPSQDGKAAKPAWGNRKQESPHRQLQHQRQQQQQQQQQQDQQQRRRNRWQSQQPQGNNTAPTSAVARKGTQAVGTSIPTANIESPPAEGEEPKQNTMPVVLPKATATRSADQVDSLASLKGSEKTGNTTQPAPKVASLLEPSATQAPDSLMLSQRPSTSPRPQGLNNRIGVRETEMAGIHRTLSVSPGTSSSSARGEGEEEGGEVSPLLGSGDLLTEDMDEPIQQHSMMDLRGLRRSVSVGAANVSHGEALQRSEAAAAAATAAAAAAGFLQLEESRMPMLPRQQQRLQPPRQQQAQQHQQILSKTAAKVPLQAGLSTTLLSRPQSPGSNYGASPSMAPSHARAVMPEAAPRAAPPPSRIKVVVRKRPLNKRELGRSEFDVIHIENSDRLTVMEPKTKVDLTKFTECHEFGFDAVFDEHVSNDTVYQETVGPIVPAVFDRTKATCFAYGQTGSGKTFTMQPLPLRAAEDMFFLLAEPGREGQQQLWVSFFEIYGGKLFDLLHDRNKLQMREDGRANVCIVGLQEVRVTSVQEVQELIQRGTAARSTGSTGANEESSRSHAILQMAIKQRPKKRGVGDLASRGHASMRASLALPGGKEGDAPLQLVGKLSFIDLAGSERGADTTDNDKQTRIEGAEINKSLLALKECIRALGAEQSHIPFRGSKLTEVLRDSFVGKSCTVMLSCVSPGSLSVEHTLNTLRYTERVKALPRGGGSGSGPARRESAAQARANSPMMGTNRRISAPSFSVQNTAEREFAMLPADKNNVLTPVDYGLTSSQPNSTVGISAAGGGADPRVPRSNSGPLRAPRRDSTCVPEKRPGAPSGIPKGPINAKQDDPFPKGISLARSLLSVPGGSAGGDVLRNSQGFGQGVLGSQGLLGKEGQGGAMGLRQSLKEEKLLPSWSGSGGSDANVLLTYSGSGGSLASANDSAHVLPGVLGPTQSGEDADPILVRTTSGRSILNPRGIQRTSALRPGSPRPGSPRDGRPLVCSPGQHRVRPLSSHGRAGSPSSLLGAAGLLGVQGDIVNLSSPDSSAPISRTLSRREDMGHAELEKVVSEGRRKLTQRQDSTGATLELKHAASESEATDEKAEPVCDCQPLVYGPKKEQPLYGAQDKGQEKTKESEPQAQPVAHRTRRSSSRLKLNMSGHEAEGVPDMNAVKATRSTEEDAVKEDSSKGSGVAQVRRGLAKRSVSTGRGRVYPEAKKGAVKEEPVTAAEKDEAKKDEEATASTTGSSASTSSSTAPSTVAAASSVADEDETSSSLSSSTVSGSVIGSSSSNPNSRLPPRNSQGSLLELHRSTVKELQESLEREVALLQQVEQGQCSFEDYSAVLYKILSSRVTGAQTLKEAVLRSSQ